ncbi:DUF4355 domain-containing protein [Lysinibacillus antri]|uniref:DUF4355 domain-containing protein n=1 Tax=Lysinibacillus antri TaxID=2498145 RepID=A0A432LFN6_9BACI|nr:DUF4355 domain-containing protein [Lysinibacillus antri]RUL56470.1 DUF4355 domain-containing protein [Lysinibacillus antri]
MKSVFKKRLPVNIKQFDGELTFEQVKAFLDSNKDNEEVKAYYKSNVLTADNVKPFLETSEGKKVLQPKLDAHFTKSLETWKANNLESLIEEEVNKRNPEKSPAEKEVEKLRAEIEKERKSRERADLSAKALKVAQEKKLPTEVIDYLIGADEETTLANLTKYEEAHTKAIQAAVDAKFKEHGRGIDHGESGGGGAIDFGAIANQVSLRK